LSIPRRNRAPILSSVDPRFSLRVIGSSEIDQTSRVVDLEVIWGHTDVLDPRSPEDDCVSSSLECLMFVSGPLRSSNMIIEDAELRAF
jgi:hypothetical protein